MGEWNEDSFLDEFDTINAGWDVAIPNQGGAFVQIYDLAEYEGTTGWRFRDEDGMCWRSEDGVQMEVSSETLASQGFNIRQRTLCAIRHEDAEYPFPWSREPTTAKCKVCNHTKKWCICQA